MPTPREYFAIAVYQNFIYCIGGSTGNVNLALNEVYDPTSDSWITKAPMPTTEEGIQANVVNGKIYILGGSSNYVYDPLLDTWTLMSPTPIKGGFTTSAVLDGKIFVIGSDATEIYDPLNDSWSTGTPYPQILDGNATSVTTSGLDSPEQIYVFNEIFSQSWSEGLRIESLIAQTTVEAYSPENNSWASGADMPSNRYSFGVAVLNDSFFVIGGCNVVLYAEWVPSSLNVVTTNEQYLPLGYGTVLISILSPLNQTYKVSNVPVIFSVNKAVAWVRYSLDGQQNRTLTRNSTIVRVANGLHNITVYANDTFGNVGASQTITFTVA